MDQITRSPSIVTEPAISPAALPSPIPWCLTKERVGTGWRGLCRNAGVLQGCLLPAALGVRLHVASPTAGLLMQQSPVLPMSFVLQTSSHEGHPTSIIPQEPSHEGPPMSTVPFSGGPALGNAIRQQVRAGCGAWGCRYSRSWGHRGRGAPLCLPSAGASWDRALHLLQPAPTPAGAAGLPAGTAPRGQRVRLAACSRHITMELCLHK